MKKARLSIRTRVHFLMASNLTYDVKVGTEIVQIRYGGNLPTSYHCEVREHPDGRFYVTAELLDEHGELSQVC